MPAFNSIRFIGDAIESIRRQTHNDWELIVVDDCSADKTTTLVQSVADNDQRICLIQLKQNSGPGVARNEGIALSRGRYIAFLDSDDWWYENKLQRVVETFRQHHPTLVFSSYNVVMPTGKKKLIKAPEELHYEELLNGCPIGCLTAVYDTEAVGKVMMPEIRQRQDWGLWLRVLREGGTGVGIQEPLACLRKHRNSMTSNKVKATYYSWRLLKEEAGLSKTEAAVGTVRHLYRACRRAWGV